MTTAAVIDPAEAARFLNRYARRYAAGAFATPTAKELAEHPDRLLAGEGWVAVTRHLWRDSHLHDWTGRRYTLPAGSAVISHLAVEPGAAVTDLDGWDWIYAHPEDAGLAYQLAAAGREVAAVRITAASELIACYGRTGTGWREYPADRATIARLDLPPLTGARRPDVLAELSGLAGWADDYPFYSDGSWGALNLRGFWPDDPTRGVKPAEMSAPWRAEHPADLARTCGWTPLAAAMPATAGLVRALAAALLVPEEGLERVRLLRMAGRDGRGGHLARHTDITDKAAGTRDGQIIRLHLPLVTDPAITMTAWSLDGTRHDVHLPAWTLWYLDARKPHAVDNPTGTDRVHLVIDCQANPTLRAELVAAEEHTQ